MVAFVTSADPDMEVGLGVGRYCDGCPRCKDSDAGFCKTQHQFGILHPVCKVCGHCVLRGTHIDNGEDVR